MVHRASINPEVIQERIVRMQAELRRLRMELRLAEAERRDRQRMDQRNQQQQGEANRG